MLPNLTHSLCRAVCYHKDLLRTPGKWVPQTIYDAAPGGLVFSDRRFPITAAKQCSTLKQVT